MANVNIAEFVIHELEGLFSLNDLHKASGGHAKHRPGYFIQNNQTKELVAEIETAGIPAVKVTEGRGGGTYACRELVIAYAAWISAAFHLKVIRVFLAQQAEAAPGISSRRWLISFDHKGRECVTPIDWDDCLLKYQDLPRLIKEPDNLLSAELIAAIAQACIERLRTKFNGLLRRSA